MWTVLFGFWNLKIKVTLSQLYKLIPTDQREKWKMVTYILAYEISNNE